MTTGIDDIVLRREDRDDNGAYEIVRYYLSACRGLPACHAYLPLLPDSLINCPLDHSPRFIFVSRSTFAQSSAITSVTWKRNSL